MKKENNNTQKTLIAIVIVGLIIVLTGGGTYAYWTWQSAESNRTNVTFTIAKPNFTITGTNVSSSDLAPTSNCSHATYSLKGNATVVAENQTSTSMTATITLSGKLTPVSGRTLTDDAKGHIHWAIKEVESSSALTSYATANCTGTNSTSFSTGTFASVGTADTDIVTTITFDVVAGQTGTKYYQIYVWIDSDYTSTNTGSTVTDPMQGLEVKLTFSENSSFAQAGA